MTRFRGWVGLLGLLALTLACGLPPDAPAPTLSPTALPPSPTFTPEPLDTGWQPVSDGIEARRLRVEMGAASDRLWLARIDPARARLRVLYEPANPRTVRGWFETVRPRLAVNAGYFTPEKRATGLVVSDGVRSGQSFAGFGGMLAVSGARVQVRSLAAQPYSPGEPLDQAVQAFPMLVQAGGLPAVIEDAGQVAMRTAVGQDRAGRLVFVVSAAPVFSLKTLSAFLAASDLDLDVAFNLDGGTSSGLYYLDQAGQPVGIDSWVNIPTVIIVE